MIPPRYLLMRLSLLACWHVVVVVGLSSTSTVVYGPQSRELLLLTAKLAAQQPGTSQSSCICAPGTQDGCRRLMYGVEYAAAGIDRPNHARPICDGDDMATALREATALVLIGTDNVVEPGTLETFMKYASDERLQKIVLVSQMGVGRGGGFLGGGIRAVRASERGLAEIAQSRNVDFSIVRAGILKGGGPGDGGGFGLDKCYYNTILDVVEYKVTLAHDKFSLGATAASVVAGDPHTLPNMVARIGNKASFDPSPTDTNRIVVASAVVAALQPDVGPLEISVGTAAGQRPPTGEEWRALFQTLQVPIKTKN